MLGLLLELLEVEGRAEEEVLGACELLLEVEGLDRPEFPGVAAEYPLGRVASAFPWFPG